jgi:hypothetical protein
LNPVPVIDGGVFVRRVCGAFAYVPAAIWDPLFKDLRKNECKSASSCSDSICQPRLLISA